MDNLSVKISVGYISFLLCVFFFPVSIHSQLKPRIEHAGMVLPKMLEITIHEKQVMPHQRVPYRKQPGDSIIIEYQQEVLPKRYILVRDGEEIGWLVGKEKDVLCLYEKLAGEDLVRDHLSEIQSYLIISNEDSLYSRGIQPLGIEVKATPRNSVRQTAGGEFSMQYFVYLTMPYALKPETEYWVQAKNMNLENEYYQFRFSGKTLLSSAIHVNQNGFKPDDPAKRAYFSIWTGTGGGAELNPLPGFNIIGAKDNLTYYSGEITGFKNIEDPEQLIELKNYSGTAVYHMDFSDFKIAGEYKISIPGIGCSYPFKISEFVWEDAFKISMNGFYTHRSGVSIEDPYSDFSRPVCFSPENNMKVYQSAFTRFELDKKNLFTKLVEGKTNKMIDDFTGGYMDAGDWDRGILHLNPTDLLLELYEVYPDYFSKLNLEIPEKNNDLPDILDAVHWNLKFFKKMQVEEGGVRYGIESGGHPINGEASWDESLDVLAFAPDMRSSYAFAASAARFARLIKKYSDSLYIEYYTAALRAMDWAEKRYASKASGEDSGNIITEKAINKRNEAALNLYIATGDKKWKKMFEATANWWKIPVSDFDYVFYTQTSAIFHYATLPATLAEPNQQKKAKEIIINLGEIQSNQIQGNGFNVNNNKPGDKMTNGYYGVPGAIELCRAFALSGNNIFISDALLACNYPLGANPMNMSFTTGVGSNWVKNPLHVDSRTTNQEPPAGITVYGQVDHNYYKSINNRYFTWGTEAVNKVTIPSAWEWPVNEAFWDIFVFAAYNEYTIHETIGPVSYIWGTLAARNNFK